MTKTVVTVHEVAQRWARRVASDQARSPGKHPSASFEGRDLWCYRMLIARWVNDGVVLLTHNDAAPTQTTKQHLYNAARCLPDSVKVFRVDSVDATPEQQLKFLREKYNSLVEKLEKSRNPGTASYRFNEIGRMAKELRAFAVEFRCDLAGFQEHTPSPRVLLLIMAGA